MIIDCNLSFANAGHVSDDYFKTAAQFYASANSYAHSTPANISGLALNNFQGESNNNPSSLNDSSSFAEGLRPAAFSANSQFNTPYSNALQVPTSAVQLSPGVSQCSSEPHPASLFNMFAASYAYNNPCLHGAFKTAPDGSSFYASGMAALRYYPSAAGGIHLASTKRKGKFH